MDDDGPNDDGDTTSHDLRERLEDLEEYETFLEVLPDPVFVMDASGYLTFANRAFDRQFGYNDTASGDVHLSDFVADKDVDTLLELLREMNAADDAEQATRPLEVEGTTTEGRSLTLGGSITLLSSNREFVGAVAVLRDISARKRREEVFTVMDRALRHNLRTNVTVITGYVDALEPAVGPEDQTGLERIRDAAKWIEKLGTSFRTLRKTIEESFAQNETVSIERVVESAVKSAQSADSNGNLTVNFSVNGELQAGPPVELAVANVVENAIVHNDRKPPTVEIWVAHAPRDGWVDIHVADDGPGIPAFEREIVLGNAAVDQLQHGSGLGLWLTRWVVEVFDGDLLIEENDPRGSVVTIRLPLASNGDGA